jgi:hypothetical protein
MDPIFIKTVWVSSLLLVAAAAPPATAAQDVQRVAPKSPASSSISEQEAHQIGLEAYVYLYPLVTMDVSRRVLTNTPPDAKPGFGPANRFHHLRAFPTAEFREVVRPNFDTLYSTAWVDLTKEPVVLSTMDTGGRYFLLPVLDMWSNVIAAPGARTTGTGKGAWALVPPGWSGALPEGVGRINATTPHLWIIGRTQTNGPADFPAVAAVQDGYALTPLSHWGHAAPDVTFVQDPSVDMITPPVVQVNTMPAAKFFAYGAELMKTNPPQPTDWSTLARLERLGIRVGESFDFGAAPAHVRAALERSVTDGLERMKANTQTIAREVNGWQMNTDTMGVYGNHYLKRAIVAMVGLGANQPEDAVYPLCMVDADGRPLSGEHDYVIRFQKNELPPVDAFWSITMYDADGFPVANPINRFAIGDRDPLQFNPDGSLEIYIQHANPGKEREANWLPAPASGGLGVTMRMYAPRAEALDGRWAAPAVLRVR